MSAINFVVRPDALYVAADTAVYHRGDGVVAAFQSKIMLTQRFPGVVCTMGTALTGMQVEAALAGCASFDDLVTAAAAHLSELEDDGFALAIGGFSDARGGAEVWYGRPGSQQFAKLELPAGYCGQPALSDDAWLRGVGFPVYNASQIRDIDAFCQTVLTLQREHRWGPAQGYPHDVCLVGGWGELATITRTDSSVRTIIEWPDENGELIQPAPIDWNEWRRTHAEQADPVPTAQAPRLSRHERRAAKVKTRKAA